MLLLLEIIMTTEGLLLAFLGTKMQGGESPWPLLDPLPTGTWENPWASGCIPPSPALPMASPSGANLSSQVVHLHGNIPISGGCNLGNQVILPPHCLGGSDS